jgi:hypothetical protein
MSARRVAEFRRVCGVDSTRESQETTTKIVSSSVIAKRFRSAMNQELRGAVICAVPQALEHPKSRVPGSHACKHRWVARDVVVLETRIDVDLGWHAIALQDCAQSLIARERNQRIQLTMMQLVRRANRTRLTLARPCIGDVVWSYASSGMRSRSEVVWIRGNERGRNERAGAVAVRRHSTDVDVSESSQNLVDCMRTLHVRLTRPLLGDASRCAERDSPRMRVVGRNADKSPLHHFSRDIARGQRVTSHAMTDDDCRKRSSCSRLQENPLEIEVHAAENSLIRPGRALSRLGITLKVKRGRWSTRGWSGRRTG